MKPTYRVFATPTSLTPNLVDPADKTVRHLLDKPPATRAMGWIIWPTEVTFDDRQLSGKGLEGAELTLLYNGHLEYWEPLVSRRWQWDSKEGRPELYPYALCEVTVNFLRLARILYDHLGLNSDVQTELCLYNIEGFVLRPYQPPIIGYIDSHFHRPPFGRADLRTGIVQTPAGFHPDQLSLRLLERVYGQFGYQREHIPLFDEQDRFTPAPFAG